MKPCVWLRMENRVFQKIIYFDCKIAPLTRKIFSASVLPSNHFQRHAKRERERERTHRRANREREIVPSSSRSHRSDCRPHPFHATVRSRHEPMNWSTYLVHRRDRAMNPWTHEPIDPSLILIDEPTNRSRHDWSCDFDFFCFDFCFLCCLYASIICNNICLDSKKMWETW